MKMLGNGLAAVEHDEDALCVREAELSMLQRLCAQESDILAAQANLANTYAALGRFEQELRLRQDVYYGRVKLDGEENATTLRAANNYAASLVDMKRLKEAKSLIRRTLPAVRRVFSDNDGTTLRMRKNYARTLYEDTGATLDDLREAVASLEDVGRIARRVLGGAHPFTKRLAEFELRDARAVLQAATLEQEK